MLLSPSILASDEDLAPAALPPGHTQTGHGPGLRTCPRSLGTQLQNVNVVPAAKAVPSQVLLPQSREEGET